MKSPPRAATGAATPAAAKSPARGAPLAQSLRWDVRKKSFLWGPCCGVQAREKLILEMSGLLQAWVAALHCHYHNRPVRSPALTINLLFACSCENPSVPMGHQQHMHWDMVKICAAPGTCDAAAFTNFDAANVICACMQSAPPPASYPLGMHYTTASQAVLLVLVHYAFAARARVERASKRMVEILSACRKCFLPVSIACAGTPCLCSKSKSRKGKQKDGGDEEPARDRASSHGTRNESKKSKDDGRDTPAEDGINLQKDRGNQMRGGGRSPSPNSESGSLRDGKADEGKAHKEDRSSRHSNKGRSSRSHSPDGAASRIRSLENTVARLTKQLEGMEAKG
eukprot:1156443-Pelagomonas_calceolata.AAC.10